MMESLNGWKLGNLIRFGELHQTTVRRILI